VYRTANISILALKTAAARNIQIGVAQLPYAAQAAQLAVLREWLIACDNQHAHATCRVTDHRSLHTDDPGKRLPTRLIDVGVVGNHKVRLCETAVGDVGEWVALSHQWGPPPHFCTIRQNLTEHLNSIDYAALPATFRDAVTVTRALGLRYLWIDSICIIQGKDGDFFQEAKRMEEVYSGAYCVLAASRASGQSSGFLQPRHERGCVVLEKNNSRRSEGFLYIYEMVDDFKSHVLESALNSRGWVMQEHALARRTIFFTDYQMYWECGDGVRCETMTKLNK
jgi:hypothetical protein